MEQEQLNPVIEVITERWAIITQRMITQTADTPQGPITMQQPIQVPLLFRNLREVVKFIEEEQIKGAPQVVFQRVAYTDAQEEQVEYFYKEKIEDDIEGFY